MFFKKNRNKGLLLRKRRKCRDYFEIALEVGIDTTGGILDLRAMEGMEGIKTVSSDELEAFRSALKECDKNSTFVILE